MAPSRFVGYRGNTLARHGKLKGIDGGVTDKAIADVLGEPYGHDDAENAYLRVCERLGITPPRRRRRYWLLAGTRLPAPIDLKAADAERSAFDLVVRNALNDSPQTRRARLAHAPRKPKTRTATVLVFDRNPDVVAEVLVRSSGKCELCDKPAPFKRADGTPYLEVHHRIRLADGGDDTVENAIAVCPNCHRQEHFGQR